MTYDISKKKKKKKVKKKKKKNPILTGGASGGGGGGCKASNWGAFAPHAPPPPGAATASTCLVRVFSVDCSNNMYDLSINKLYILLGNLYICPHNRKVFVRMVILFYPATSARVHFTKCDHCATAASFRRWLAPVVGAFLTVAYRLSSWDRFS